MNEMTETFGLLTIINSRAQTTKKHSVAEARLRLVQLPLAAWFIKCKCKDQ